MPQIADLTLYQINSIYFHPRDEDGSVHVPTQPRGPNNPPTFEDAMADLLGWKPLLTEENFRQTVKDIHVKFGRPLPDELKPDEQLDRGYPEGSAGRAARDTRITQRE